jgi:hypothetical protein
MTEPLTLTVVTAALYMLARAIEEPSMWRYGVFVAWATAAAAVRLQRSSSSPRSSSRR